MTPGWQLKRFPTRRHAEMWCRKRAAGDVTVCVKHYLMRWQHERGELSLDARVTGETESEAAMALRRQMLLQTLLLKQQR